MIGTLRASTADEPRFVGRPREDTIRNGNSSRHHLPLTTSEELDALRWMQASCRRTSPDQPSMVQGYCSGMVNTRTVDDRFDPIEAIAAERAIKRCLLDYCRGIDRCDVPLAASAYHADATDDHGTFVGLGVDFVAAAIEHLRTRTRSTTHFLSEPIIDFTSTTSADVEVQVLAWHRISGESGEYLEKFCGRYHDRFECRNGDWRISHRSLTWDWDAKELIENAFRPGAFTPSPRY